VVCGGMTEVLIFVGTFALGIVPGVWLVERLLDWRFKDRS